MRDPDASATADTESIGDRATRGAAWTLIGFAGTQVVRLGGNLVLTRLLFEEAFGMMALLDAFIQGLALFSDLGIGPAIVQNKRGEDPRFLDTAWTIQVGRGFLLWAVAMLGAVPFAQFYDEPMLAVVLPVLAVTTLFNGFNSTKLFTANRRIQLGRLTILEVVARVLGTGAMIVWALFDRSVWALVCGALVHNGSRLLLSHILLPGRINRFAFDRNVARELFTFGRWIFVSTLLTFLSTQSDRLIFGKMIPLNLLGVYSIGMLVASFPANALAKLSQNITLPVLSSVRRSGEPMGPAYRRIRLPILLLAGWGMCGLMAGGPTAIRLLYDPRYAEAGWIVQLLAFGMWFRVTEVVNFNALLAQGRSRWVAIGSFGKFVSMVVLIFAGHSLFGFPGAVAGYSLSEFCRYVVSVYALRRTGVRALKQDVTLTALMIGVAAVVGWGARQAHAAGAPVALEAAGVALAVTLFWLPLGFPLLRDLVRRRRAKRAGLPHNGSPRD